VGVGRWGLDLDGSCAVKTESVDKTIRKYATVAELNDIKAQEYRYWQSRPVHERTDAVSELTRALYAMKGAVADVPRLQRTLVRFKRAPR
jgi:hypothetical protein